MKETKKTPTKAKSTKKPGKTLKIVDKPIDYTKYIKEIEKKRRK